MVRHMMQSMPTPRPARFIALALATALAAALPAVAAPSDDLKVVIIRHGEKPADGDNLSCAGANRAYALPEVLLGKIGVPGHTYVPALELGKGTRHARMFQTIVPFAIAQNLKIDSRFGETDVAGAARDVRQRKGTVLMVWEHSRIPPLAASLGVKDPPSWDGDDFDSMWIVTYRDGQASLEVGAEGIEPAGKCPF